MQRRHLGVVIAVGAVLVTVGLFAGPLSRNFRWGEFTAGLRSLDPWWALAGTILSLGTYLIRAIRWRAMMTPIRQSADLRSILSSTLIGFTAVVLFGRPGEVVRPWLIAVRQKVPVSSQFAAWFLERIFDLLSVVLLFGVTVGGIGLRLNLSPRMRTLVSAAGSLALVAGGICVLFLLLSAIFAGRTRAWCNWLLERLPNRLRTAATRPVHSFLDGLQSTGSARSVAAVGVWTVLEWAVICASIKALFRAFPPTQAFTWHDTLVFTGFIAFGSVVQLPGIGGGMQVASILVLTELFGLGVAEATACTLLVWVVGWLTVLPFGLGSAFMEGLHWRNLRKVAMSESEVVTE